MSNLSSARSKGFLGIDLGSSYTKFVVINSEQEIVFHEVIPTLSRRRERFEEILETINQRYIIHSTCTTGYGRTSYAGDLQKTELICAAIGVTALHPVNKCIIDIGGEDIKIIECDANGAVEHFYMNDKCSSGTGAFITEIAEKAELEISEMSRLAQASQSTRIMNSFCTVFAKTEILNWKFGGVPLEDMARGIYLSIVNRIRKMPVRSDRPVYLCGGVIAYHPFLKILLSDALGVPVEVTDKPQYIIALGAAVLARQSVPKLTLERAEA